MSQTLHPYRLVDLPSAQKCPPEISDMILDFLHLGIANKGDVTANKAALRVCSLICREWLPSTRYHLFRTVTIECPSKVDAITTMLSEHPGLGFYAKELVVCPFSFYNPVTYDITKCLSYIPHIQNVTFKVMDWFMWDHLYVSPTVMPNVRRLTLSSVNNCTWKHFLQLLSLFPALEFLHVGCADICSHERVTDDNRAVIEACRRRFVESLKSYPCLREFSVDMVREDTVGTLFACARDSPAFKQVESFRVSCESRNAVMEVGSFLQTVGPFGLLRRLHLSISEVVFDKFSVEEFSKHLSLHSCFSLESLTLTIAIDIEKEESHAFDLVCALLSESTHLKSLRHFTIGFCKYRIACDHKVYLDAISALPWGNLDDSLREFQALKKVTVMSTKVMRHPEESDGLFLNVDGETRSDGRDDVRRVILDKLSGISRRLDITFA